MKLSLACGRFSDVDDDIYPLLKTRRWSIKPHGKTFYAKTNGFRSFGEQTTQYLHWFVIGKPFDGLEVDHINGNGLDNRRENLTVVTHRKNMQNIHVQKSSKYPGVYWNKECKKWQAYAHSNGAAQYIGIFTVEEDAAEASASVRRYLNL